MSSQRTAAADSLNARVTPLKPGVPGVGNNSRTQSVGSAPALDSTGLMSTNEVTSPYSKVLTQKQNAIDRLFQLGGHPNLGILETPKTRRQRRGPTSHDSRKLSPKYDDEGTDMSSGNAQKSHSSSPDPISGQPSPPGSVVSRSEPRITLRRLAESGSPTMKRRKERTTSPGLGYGKTNKSPTLKVRPPKPPFDVRARGHNVLEPLVLDSDESTPRHGSPTGDGYQAPYAHDRYEVLQDIFENDVWPFVDDKIKQRKFSREDLLKLGGDRALEILQSQSNTPFHSMFASLDVLDRMLCGRLPQAPKTYEETKEDLRKKYAARGRSRRIGGAKRPGRNYKKEVYELPGSGTRSDLSLSLPLDTSHDEEILDSIEVKSSLDAAASPSASEGAYPSGYSFSTGDDPSSNTSPSSPFSDTVTLTAPTHFPSQKDNQLGLPARPAEAPGCNISIPILAPISSFKASGVATRSLASHIFIKSETPQSDGQPRRSQRPKGLDGLIASSTEAKPSRLRSGFSSTMLHDPCYIPTRRTHDFNSILRTRELGVGKWYGPQVDVKGMNAELGTHIARDLACWRSWTGASKDIVAAAWAPDGCTYALGASTDMDNLNIQYNRPNNLLIGNNEANTLTELKDHFIDRPRPETIGTGENSLEGTYNSVDPELYTTVSHVCFGHTSDRLYSASFDKTVKIWDLDESGRATCVKTLQHESNVELLSLSHQSSNLLATCQRTLSASIRIYDLLDSKPWVSLKTTLESPRAKKVSVYPTSLLAGTSPETSHLVLAGFSENSMEEKHDREGELCLWDVRTQSHFRLLPSSQAILDLAWHPHSMLFAAASAPGSRMDLTNRWAKSVIRTYTPLETASRIMEYECPAVDINEIHFHPFDDHYISAGCTDSITYVWDVRMPENILHELRHDKPIDELDPTRTREDQDTGVRFTAWDKNGLDLYTGSSDGKIKVWNIFASPEDCHVRDVAQFDGAVMTGKFSPDSSNLIVGLSKGAVHILSTCPTTHDPEEEDDGLDTDDLRTAYETIRYIPATNPADDIEPSGAELADELLCSGQIIMHPIFGAGKGPYYKGPFATYARPPGTDPEMEDLDPDILASQLDPVERKRGRRKGGKLDIEARVRYREANRIAEARNGPYRFREGKRKPPKREVEYDSIRVEDRVVYDGETIRVGVAGLKVREVKPIKEEQVKRPRQRGSTQSSSGRGSMRGSQKGRKGHQYWEDNDIIVIDEDD